MDVAYDHKIHSLTRVSTMDRYGFRALKNILRLTVIVMLHARSLWPQNPFTHARIHDGQVRVAGLEEHITFNSDRNAAWT